MEDGIERSIMNYNCEKKEAKETKEAKEESKEKYIYIFMPSNGNYIIFFDKDKAIEHSQKKGCRVDIYIESENSAYTYTKNYYESGNLVLFSV